MNLLRLSILLVEFESRQLKHQNRRKTAKPSLLGEKQKHEEENREKEKETKLFWANDILRETENKRKGDREGGNNIRSMLYMTVQI